jgi:hypothetical protein
LLTFTQIASIIMLLQAFGVSTSTIAIVQNEISPTQATSTQAVATSTEATTTPVVGYTPATTQTVTPQPVVTHKSQVSTQISQLQAEVSALQQKVSASASPVVAAVAPPAPQSYFWSVNYDGNIGYTGGLFDSPPGPDITQSSTTITSWIVACNELMTNPHTYDCAYFDNVADAQERDYSPNWKQWQLESWGLPYNPTDILFPAN